jgi:hypothetical protein
MISSEVQRTLVKSPPELWSELSDPAALARHLGELGEIRIVRVEPEKTVEWEAENTTGTVSIQPSGWGTKVTLSVTRELVTPAPDSESQAAPAQTAAPAEPEAAEIEPAVELEPAAETEPALSEPEPTADQATEPTNLETPEPTQPAPRRGFFARLFGRRRREEITEPEAPAAVTREPITPDPVASEPVATEPLVPEPSAAFAAVSEALALEAQESHAFADPPGHAPAAEPSRQTDHAEPAEASVPESEAQLDQSADIAAELMAAEEVAAEEVAAEEVTAVLAAVLDRLGAAHHRPFSRS